MALFGQRNPLLAINAEAPVKSETNAAISLKPDIDDLVPSEASPRHAVATRQMCLHSRKSYAAALTIFFPMETFLPKPTARCGSK